jgi:transposase
MLTESEQANLTIADLRRTVADLEAQLQKRDSFIKELESQLIRANHRIEQLIKQQFGRSSEKIPKNDPPPPENGSPAASEAPSPSPQAGDAADPALDQPASPPPAPTPGKRSGASSRHKHGRSPLPEHLERRIVVIMPPEEDCICPITGEPKVIMDYDISEKLAFEPAQLYVIVYKRAKLVSPQRHNGHTGVTIAPMPDFPIARCKADLSLLAAVVTSKFADHLPLYRQKDIFLREGVSISDSTMDGWLMELGATLRPVITDAFKQALFEAYYLASDDTPVDLIVPGRGSVRQARLWIYLRHHDPPPPGTPPRQPPFTVRPRLVYYDFTVDRSGERPNAFLEHWRGPLQIDAYSGYNLVLRREGMVEVGCWSHARRGFVDALQSRPREATEVITLIAELYAVEAEVRGCDPATRLAARQAKSVPVLKRIFSLVAVLAVNTLPAEPLAKACGYLVNQRDALWRYTADGRVEIDNNTAENWIRPIAVGRNNWMFMGSEEGGKTNAMFLSLVQSCRCNNIDPWRYLCDLFKRIMSHPAHRVRELLPDVWWRTQPTMA